tara:strand:- start:66808 stop:67287 length:480 start_codon:yes stop_codon:yes gene_type:complete
MVKVLFICLGNICRSPAAHGVFQSLIEKKGLEGQLFVDSAGTSAFHEGELPDQRMREHGLKRGLKLESLSRKLVVKDFDEFDYLIVMDESNYKNSYKLATKDQHREKLYRMADFLTTFKDDEIPDPYYGGSDGFEYVLDLVTEGSENLMNKILNERKLG